MSKLLIIDPSVNVAEHEGARVIAGCFRGDFRVLLPAMREADRLRDVPLRDVAGVVVMGSASSVYDGLPWQRELEDWLRPVFMGDVGCPLMGLCFGHQLVAKMGGGAVGYLEPASKAKRLGVEESVFRGSRYMPDGAVRVVVSHREHVVEAPPGFRVVATRPGVAVDALEHETRPIFSVQFHPEAGPEFASHAGMPDGAIPEAVRSSGRRVLRSFLDVIDAA